MRACVLSGGSNKGIAQVGFIRAIHNHDPELDYDLFCGLSVGSINAAFLATGPLKETLPQLEKMWFEKVKGNHSVWQHHLMNYIIFDIVVILLFTIAAFISFILTAPKLLTLFLGFCALACFYLPYYTVGHTHSVYKTDPLKKLINDGLDLNKLKSSGKKLRVGAVSFTTGKYHVATEQDDNIKDWIMASSSFPLFFPMPFIDGEYWVDGGLTSIALLHEALELGATEIDIILTSPMKVDPYSGHPGIIKQLVRDLDIVSAEMFKKDLTNFTNIKVRVFMPEKTLTSNSLNFDPVRLKRMYVECRTLGEKIVNVVS